MAEPDAGTKLTLLGDTDTVSPDALPDLYAYPEPLSRCWVRSNFITSLDGGATLDGVSGGLAGPGDRALFKVLRDATKPEIKAAVELMFKVEVKSVSTVTQKGKVKRFGKSIGRRDHVKKAYVCLKPGQELNFSGEAA